MASVLAFDHAIVGVAHLDEAIAAYERLGFVVQPGGQHPQWGTHNALVRFADGYVELIAVRDPTAAGAIGPAGGRLLEFLAHQPGGLIGLSLRTTDIAADAERWERAGITAQGPFAMQRRRPDGTTVSWRLLVPDGMPWLTAWPFLIQWDGPPAGPDAPPVHPNGVTGVAEVAVAARDPDRALRRYRDLLGQEPDGTGFALGATTLHVVADAGGGEGPTELALAADLPSASAVLGADADVDGPQALRVRPGAAVGAHVRLVAS